jgi:hypothetical protein
MKQHLILILTATSLALISAVAFAETSVSTKSSTSVSTKEGTTVESTTTSEESADFDGTVTEKTHTYEAEPGATSHSASVTKVNPDGSRSTYKEQHTLSTEEDGDVVEKKTTTTSRDY